MDDVGIRKNRLNAATLREPMDAEAIFDERDMI
jgi:hypothetical protein